MRINVINIGCFKNLVDCEKLMKQLLVAGHDVVFGDSDSHFDIAIINTCGFIGNADSDSLQLLRQYAKRKSECIIKELWVMGCYSQKRGEKLRIDVPEVDRIYGNFDWGNILVDLGSKSLISHERTLTTPNHYAYLKISEGCNSPCSYCIKPKINGPLTSYDIKDLVEEARYLVKNGVKEIQFVAQNLTAYGLDIYKEKRIADLVNRIADIDGVEWIRLHYAYPVGFPLDLLDTIRQRENVCNYLDMAIQHCNTRMLKLMRRGMTKEQLTELIATIRDRVPGIYLRTTVMTGHPGETQADFDELYEFVKEQRFERMGVFAYSHQSGTYCDKNYVDDVPQNVKIERALSLMSLQKSIYESLNGSLVGTVEKVIIDGKHGEYYVGRGEHSTPMADPKIYISSNLNLNVGDFYNVRITGVRGKDINGEIIN
ncbi:MAG: 30S ribosomal protein S12 methylthiotransferase RimO [Bacteroidaceae bacterium]|nr:30S ribosomal protein S12 methylthiotransferase RimO [Bacteroidaceae bacterium]